MLIPQQAPKMNELNMDQSGSGQSDNSQRRHDSWGHFLDIPDYLFYINELKSWKILIYKSILELASLIVY